MWDLQKAPDQFWEHLPLPASMRTEVQVMMKKRIFLERVVGVLWRFSFSCRKEWSWCPTSDQVMEGVYYFPGLL